MNVYYDRCKRSLSVLIPIDTFIPKIVMFSESYLFFFNVNYAVGLHTEPFVSALCEGRVFKQCYYQKCNDNAPNRINRQT